MHLIEPNDPDLRMRRLGVHVAMVFTRRARTLGGVVARLFEHPEVGPWLRKQPDPEAAAEAIVRDAEDRTGHGHVRLL